MVILEVGDLNPGTSPARFILRIKRKRVPMNGR
jgi:hypothetical protein